MLLNIKISRLYVSSRKKRLLRNNIVNYVNNFFFYFMICLTIDGFWILTSELLRVQQNGGDLGSLFIVSYNKGEIM